MIRAHPASVAFNVNRKKRGPSAYSSISTFGFPSSNTLIQPSPKQAMKEIPICTTLAN
jgi:hypothetical protein